MPTPMIFDDSVRCLISLILYLREDYRARETCIMLTRFLPFPPEGVEGLAFTDWDGFRQTQAMRLHGDNGVVKKPSHPRNLREPRS